jgi:hypothetical protein
MFTPIAIEGLYSNADGTTSTGTITATPNSALVDLTEDSTQDQTRAPIVGIIDELGRIAAQDGLAFVLNATDDEGTLPIGASYTFTLTLDGEQIVEFSSPVPHNPTSFGGLFPKECVDTLAQTTEGSNVITLVNLLAASSMIGATVTGSHFATSTTITAVDALANTITVIANATSTGVDDTLTIAGGCIPFSTLQANAL